MRAVRERGWTALLALSTGLTLLPCAVGAQVDADPADPAVVQAAEAAVQRLGDDRAGRIVATVRAIPALATAAGAAGRSLQVSVQELEAAKRELAADEDALEVRVALPADVLFDVDRADIRADAASALQHLAALVRGYRGAVQLIGHTDADGSEAHNQQLSERRAGSVRDWLVAQGKVERSRLATEGRGEREPVAPNDSAAGKQANRRVEVVIRKD